MRTTVRALIASLIMVGAIIHATHEAMAADIGEEELACPPGSCPLGGRCYPCSSVFMVEPSEYEASASETTGGEELACPPGTCPVGGRCYPCSPVYIVAPPEAEALEPVTTGGEELACPPGSCPVGGRCYPCSSVYIVAPSDKAPAP